jgi:hypothetical protein
MSSYVYVNLDTKRKREETDTTNKKPKPDAADEGAGEVQVFAIPDSPALLASCQGKLLRSRQRKTASRRNPVTKKETENQPSTKFSS